jgi:cytochrome c biogenesis protein CcmG, thiol:disulfide interchange protein DsbE
MTRRKSLIYLFTLHQRVLYDENMARRTTVSHMRSALFLLCAVFAWRPAFADTVLDLAAFRGQVVYVDFWASWCAPCLESFPWMNQLQDKFARDGLVVIAVNVDREHAAAERFLKQHAAHFHVVFDPDGLTPQKFDVRRMPTSLLVDRNGEVRLRHEGFRLVDREPLEQQIRALIHTQ